MTASSTIDTRTAEIIRSAMAAAQGGRFQEACEIGERGLASGGDEAALNAMIGSFLCHVGDFERSITHLHTAQAARPSDPIIARNLATALTGSERYSEAVAACHDDMVANDKSGALARLRGFAAQMTGDLEKAISDYERVVAAHPRDWETLNNLGNAKVAAGDLEGGVEALSRSARLNPRASETRLNLALALRDMGRLREAETELRLIAADFTDDPVPLGYLFALLQMQGLDADARVALEHAIDRKPNDVGMLIALAREQLLAFEISRATETFRRVLQLDPANGDAFLGLADALEHERPEGLPDLLAEAEAAGVDDDRIKLISALIARREKRYEDGVAALKGVPVDFDPVRRWHLQGQLLDGAADYDGAFAAYSRMNQVLADEPTQPLRRAAELREELRERLGQTTPEWRSRWITHPLLAERASPVFLVGFPRSGTTLLDTMLMGHPNVEVMEERPVLAQLRAEGASFEELASLGEADVRRLQERYFELAANHAALREDSLLVDKSPLHMQSLPQIFRLFPNARIILALRHPADVVLSCFMAKFRMNASMSNFVQLDTTAEFYDLSFSMWERSRTLFPVEVHTVVYESMVDDPEAVLRPLVEGLGLQWHSGVTDHQRTAKSRGVITTASYAQVTEPLYKGAAGRWQRYRKHLEAVLPTLRPWAEKFGYEL